MRWLQFPFHIFSIFQLSQCRPVNKSDITSIQVFTYVFLHCRFPLSKKSILNISRKRSYYITECHFLRKYVIQFSFFTLHSKKPNAPVLELAGSV